MCWDSSSWSSILLGPRSVVLAFHLPVNQLVQVTSITRYYKILWYTVDPFKPIFPQKTCSRWNYNYFVWLWYQLTVQLPPLLGTREVKSWFRLEVTNTSWVHSNWCSGFHRGSHSDSTFTALIYLRRRFGPFQKWTTFFASRCRFDTAMQRFVCQVEHRWYGNIEILAIMIYIYYNTPLFIYWLSWYIL